MLVQLEECHCQIENLWMGTPKKTRQGILNAHLWPLEVPHAFKILRVNCSHVHSNKLGNFLTPLMLRAFQPVIIIIPSHNLWLLCGNQLHKRRYESKLISHLTTFMRSNGRRAEFETWTPFVVFSVTYYLDLHKGIYSLYHFSFLFFSHQQWLTKVVWTICIQCKWLY